MFKNPNHTMVQLHLLALHKATWGHTILCGSQHCYSRSFRLRESQNFVKSWPWFIILRMAVFNRDLNTIRHRPYRKLEPAHTLLLTVPFKAYLSMAHASPRCIANGENLSDMLRFQVQIFDLNIIQKKTIFRTS